MTDIVLFPAGHISGLLALLMGLVFGILLPGLIAMVGMFLVIDLRARGAAADRMASDNAPLKPGPAVLCGRVRLADGETEAVTVEVFQSGEQWTSRGQIRHRWRETERHITTFPFFVEDPRGMIRVEPPEDVTLIDRMDRMERVSDTTRIRTAELSPGEPIFATGTLVDQGGELVLRADEDGEMLLSSQPLHTRFDLPARIHGLFTIAALTLLVLGSLAGVPMTARAVAGYDDVGTVTAKRTWTTHRRKRAPERHYEVTVQTPGGGTLQEQVAASDFQRVQQGSRVALRGIVGMPHSEALGNAPSGPAMVLVLLLAAACGLPIFWMGGMTRTRPWWEGALVDDGTGPLTRPY